MHGRNMVARLNAWLIIAAVAWASCADYHVGDPGGEEAECAEDADCPSASEDYCQARKCDKGQCITEKLVDLPSPLDPEGDCMAIYCDTHGEPLSGTNDGDPEDDGNPCTIDQCDNGATFHLPMDCHELVCVEGMCVMPGP